MQTLCFVSCFSFSVFEHTDPKILCGPHWNIFSHLWAYSCELIIFPVYNHAYYICNNSYTQRTIKARLCVVSFSNVLPLCVLPWQIFEWWYFRKYGTSFIEQVSVSHLRPLLGGVEGSSTTGLFTSINGETEPRPSVSGKHAVHVVIETLLADGGLTLLCCHCGRV